MELLIHIFKQKRAIFLKLLFLEIARKDFTHFTLLFLYYFYNMILTNVIVLERRQLFSSIIMNNYMYLYSYIRKSISQVYKPTIGADFHSKKLELMDGGEVKNVTLQVLSHSV
jgi:hypothetical protein